MELKEQKQKLYVDYMIKVPTYNIRGAQHASQQAILDYTILLNILSIVIFKI